MSTQSFAGYNPKYNPSQNQNPKFAMTYNIPDKKAPSETVNKIFLRIANGKYFDIKRMIAQERSSLNLHDIQNKSIIHYILLNQGLSKNDKYELIKQVLDVGAPVDSSDSNGVRPLHLASGQQNRNLINLLLEKGAEINSQDNNFMTPLHYAVTPETLTCKPINEKKLIPSRDPLMNQRSDPLFDILFNNFQKDPTVRMYISHLAHIFKFRFPYDDNDVLQDTKDLNRIIEELSNQKAYSGEDIKIAFDEKLISFNKTIYTKTLTKLQKSITKVNIKEGTKNGWGPGDQDEQKILPFKTIASVHSEIHKGLSKNLNAALHEIEQSISSIDKKIDDYTKSITNVVEIFDVLFSYHIFIHTFFEEHQIIGESNAIERVTVGNLNKTFKKLMSNMTINDEIIPNDFNAPNFTPQPIKPSTQIIIKKSIFEHNMNIPHYDGKIIIFNRIDNYIADVKLIIENINRRINTTKNDIMNGSVDSKSQTNIIKNICDMQLSLMNVTFIMFLLANIHEEIMTAMDDFFSDYSTNNYPLVYNSINNLMKDIYNKCSVSKITGYNYFSVNDRLSLHLIHNDLTLYNGNHHGYKFKVYAKILPQNKMLFIATNNLVGYSGPEYYIVYNNHDNYVFNLVTKKLITQSKFDFFDEKMESINNFIKKKIQYREDYQYVHNTIINAQKKINVFIDIHNQVNGSIFTFLFNNRMTDNSYTKTHTDTINHLLVTRMKHVNLLPDTFEDIYTLIKPLFFHGNTYVPQNGINVVKLMIDLYGYNITNDNKLYIVDISTTSFFERGLLTTIIKKNSAIVQNKVITLGSISNLNKVLPAGTTVGYNLVKNKIEQNLSVVGTVLDYHIYLIKLIVIMYFVQKIHALKKNDILFKQFYSYNAENFANLSESNKSGILIAMVAKMVDDIMINTFKNFAHISATNYVNYLIKNVNPTLKTTLLDATIDPPINITNFSQLIVKPTDRLKFKNGNYIDQIVSDSIDSRDKNPVIERDDLEMLQFFAGKDNTNDKLNNFQNRLIDFDSIVSTNDMCFDVDEDIVSLLLSKGADNNIVDRSGMTPLWFAIYLQNERIIGTLLKTGSINNQNLYDTVYKQLLNTVQGSPIMNINEINQRVEDHLKKKSSMSQLFSNSHLILEMTSYLFIHQLTANAGYYPNLWSRNSHQKILGMIGMDQTQDLIPLAKVNPEIISENIKGYLVINQTIDSYKKQLTDERDILIRIDHSIRDLENELNSLLGHDANQNNYRITEMNELLSELFDQKRIITNNIGGIIQKIRNMTNEKITINNKEESDEIINAMSKSNKIHSIVKTQKSNRFICDIYETFFKKIMNDGKEVVDSEYVTYINLWTDLLSSPDHVLKKDFTQVIKNLQLYIVEQGVQKPNIFIDSWDPICELYEKVLDKYGKDYLELSMYMNNNDSVNYVLKQIYCIIFHVFSHIISVNYIATITQFLAKQDTGETSNSVARNIFMAMKTSGFIAHCMDTMPHQIIKIVCKIYESEKDPLAQSNVTDILNKSLDFLSQSTFVGINENKINMIKESIVPFFTSYMEAYTAEMHALIVKQIKSFIVQNKWLRIINILAEKAQIEANSNLNTQTL